MAANPRGRRTVGGHSGKGHSKSCSRPLRWRLIELLITIDRNTRIEALQRVFDISTAISSRNGERHHLETVSNIKRASSGRYPPTIPNFVIGRPLNLRWLACRVSDTLTAHVELANVMTTMGLPPRAELAAISDWTSLKMTYEGLSFDSPPLRTCRS